MSKRSVLAVGIVALVLSVASSKAAFACGGFFCSGPTPVVQAAERVVFEKFNDGRIRTWVQIQYQGPPVGFSWVIPVSAVPTAIDLASTAAFAELDQATAPQFQFTGFGGGGGSGGCGCAGSTARSAGGVDTVAPTGTGVTVWSTARVGSYDTAVISAPDAALVLDWLAANSYTIPASAAPILQTYANEGQKFVAFRYAPDGGGQGSLDPVVIEYLGDVPCVPIRITAIATSPVLDVMILAFGPSRAWPAPGFVLTMPDYNQIGRGGRLYADVVLAAITDAGGRALVTEFADATDRLAAGLSDPESLRLLGAHPWVTRFYTRLTPEAMTMDPMFVFSPGATVSNSHAIDLSASRPEGRGRRSGGVAYAAMPLLLVLFVWLSTLPLRRR
jgi:hypothetical protein